MLDTGRDQVETAMWSAIRALHERGMTFDDRKSLAKVIERSKTDQYMLSTLIESLVLSDLFLKR